VRYVNLNYFFLDRFLEGRLFGRKKGHQLDNFGESQLMALEESSGGINPSETAFFFYRISPEKSSRSSLSRPTNIGPTRGGFNWTHFIRNLFSFNCPLVNDEEQLKEKRE
jgi:hypothetical protein